MQSTKLIIFNSHFHLQELKEYEIKLKELEVMQLNSTALMNEEFRLGAENKCIDHHAYEDIGKLKQRIEELETQVC
jgi:hypothetical protein